MDNSMNNPITSGADHQHGGRPRRRSLCRAVPLAADGLQGEREGIHSRESRSHTADRLVFRCTSVSLPFFTSLFHSFICSFFISIFFLFSFLFLFFLFLIMCFYSLILLLSLMLSVGFSGSELTTRHSPSTRLSSVDTTM